MTTPDTASFKPPEADDEDLAYALVKASIDAIPLIGSSAAEMFSLVVTPSLDKRRMKWMTLVGETLTLLLQQKGLDFKALASDEEFIDAVLQTSQTAMRTSQQDKLDILRNVIVNRALNVAPDITTQNILLKLVDSLTPLHIHILNQFRSGTVQLRWKHPPGTGTFHFYKHFEELRDYPIGQRIWQDLLSEGLLVQGMLSSNDVLDVSASELGDLLLDLIAEPSL